MLKRKVIDDAIVLLWGSNTPNKEALLGQLIESKLKFDILKSDVLRYFKPEDNMANAPTLEGVIAQIDDEELRNIATRLYIEGAPLKQVATEFGTSVSTLSYKRRDIEEYMRRILLGTVAKDRSYEARWNEARRLIYKLPGNYQRAHMLFKLLTWVKTTDTHPACEWVEDVKHIAVDTDHIVIALPELREFLGWIKDPVQSSILHSVYIDELGLAEIATKLGRTKAEVTSHLVKARRELRRRI